MTILKNRFIVLILHPTGMDFVESCCCLKISKSIELVNRLFFYSFSPRLPFKRCPCNGIQMPLPCPTAPFRLTQKLESPKVSINPDVALNQTILHFETFEKCSILPAQLNPYLIFNRGSRPRQFCRIAELDSCQAARKGEGHGRPESTRKF